MTNKRSYWLLFAGLTAIVILSLGGGLWGAEQSIGHWTGLLFERVCHQNPQRSFQFNGVPMAVNSRCFGIFTGLWSGWFFVPLIIKKWRKIYWISWFLFLAVMLQIIDYMGNHILWENTNATRVVSGFILGIAVAIFLSDLFRTKNKKA
ncbi:DUF2085 domain-containing protein [Rhodohalobacter sp. 614A]|uniref:DUF2085 domain-containing protein n=1 Tax=Rhodohalobacter sp. 614A TaxID=2908649 RepID=UPI001F428441|nr:DUF2085 domain-containing protein [Rhodohalobacter sp. 614A]